MAKRYYWLKLKEDFFNQKEIKLLRRIAGGDTYTIIYLKLLLLSLRTTGKVYFEGIGDNFVDELSLEIDEDVENIKVTLSFLQSKGLLEIVNDSEYFMSDIPSMIGSETDAAVRKRRSRTRQKKKELEQKEDKTEQLSDQNVTRSHLSHTDIDIEKEQDIEKQQEQDVAAIIQFWDNNGFGFNNISGKEKLLLWLDDSQFQKPAEMILKAMDIACANNKRTFNYVEGILKNWEKSSLLTVEEVEQDEEQKQNKGGKQKNETHQSSYEQDYSQYDFS